MEPKISLQQLCLFSASAGIISHLAYFIHGEHHREAVLLFRLSIVLPLVTILGLSQYGGMPPAAGVKLTATLMGSYLATLWTSMIIYRLFFHRLRGFPGPVLARVTKFYHVSRLFRQDNFRQLDQLHRQYGDIVRVGPAELSIIMPEAVHAILGPGSRCTKAPWYDGSLPIRSMHTERDRILHDKRRRIWDQGFSSKALRSYEGRIAKYTEEFMECISSMTGESLDAALWFDYFAFDVMGDLAFGKSFGMLRTGKSHFILDLLHGASEVVGVLTPVPWVFTIMASLPIISRKFQGFLNWCEEQVEERKKMTIEVPDVMSSIIEASLKSTNPSLDREWMMGDSRLLVVAGSDTTAATLTFLSYHLAADQGQAEKLRNELQQFGHPGSPISHKDLQSADLLNGMINETLRLHHPVPSGVLRLTPSDGITIKNVFIPGNITLGVPFFTIGRSEEAFVDPDKFIPERWYSRPELVKNKSAFAPFALGPYSCIGKQLALMEIRSLISRLVLEFNIHFAPGEDGHALLEESHDVFTLKLESLNLVFEKRH